MTDDPKGERLIETWRRLIHKVQEALPTRRAVGTTANIIMNYRRWGESHIGIGIIQWRRGEDPRSEFAAGLGAIEQGMAEAVALQASPNDIDQLDLYVAHPIAYLMNRTLPVLKGADEQLKEFPMLAASELLADALFDRPYRDRLPAIMQALGSKKRQMLAFRSFQIYFELLDGVEDPVRLDDLVAEANSLYERRPKDGYYQTVIFGGGSENSIMLDWQLAAVLKKIGFQGESTHRWLWD